MSELKELLIELDNVAAPTEELIRDLVEGEEWPAWNAIRNLQRFFHEFGQNIAVLVKKEGDWEVIFPVTVDEDNEFLRRIGIKPPSSFEQ